MRPICGVLLLSLAACGMRAQSTGANSPLPAATLRTAADEGLNGLMPLPAQTSVSAGRFLLTMQFSASVAAFQDARLEGALQRTLQQLRRRTGLPLNQARSEGSAGQLTLEVAGPGEAIQSVDEDESYRLTVTPEQIHLKAATVVGALRGLQTLLQLVQPSDNGFSLPAVTIEDAPRFRWRGLMLDCGRHFEPVPVLKRTLDGMAAVKLNVFHWHLTEDQGFRMESKLYPRLTEAGSDGLFYTQEQAAEVVEYARDRGIRVVPEFEMPGHATAWLVAYPELASGRPPAAIRREFGISDLALDPTREETYTFLARFLREMAAIFPDPYLHIGGDETVSPEWKTDPRIRAFMQAHNLASPDALQAYFNGRVLEILNGLHKHMVGWDEILNPALPRDVVIQSWRGESSLVQGAQGGYGGILSAGYYLDGMRSAGEHYLVDPLPSTTALSPQQRKLILGGEICMFSEHVDQWSIESRLWPRSAAIAERLWSPEEVENVDDMYRRLSVVSIELESLGLQHITHEDAALRELAGRENIDALRTFASVLEPVSFSERYQQQKTSQLTVLDHFVDAVRPDPPLRYRVSQLTREFLKAPRTDEADRHALTAIFETVQASVPGVQDEMRHAPLLQDVQQRAEQLPGLLATGLEAIRLLSAGDAAPSGWRTRELARIEAARKPAGIVRFTFLDDLQLLVNAVRP